MKQPASAMIVAAAVVWVGISAGAQGVNKFKARLSWMPIDATTAPTIAGAGSATAELSGSRLTVTGTFEGLRSPATMAQLHNSVKTGVSGPVISDLTITKATSGTIGGSAQLTPVQVDDLRKGRLYIQIHSEKAPEGNLRGWLLQ
jgi:DNA-binding transcriptional regulator YdaS (Cro superfamily)